MCNPCERRTLHVMSNTKLLVTGASGHLGRRVVELLLEKGAHIIAVTRDPAKLADFAKRGVEVRKGSFDDDVETLAKTFSGAARLLIISTDAIDGAGTRLKQHTRAVDAAKRAGVKHLVYTSLTNADSSPVTFAPDHAGTERAIIDSGLSYSILRNNWYTEYLQPGVSHALATGDLAGAAGKGTVGYVSREDCAHAAAGALARDVNEKRIYEITGPAAVGYDELASTAAEVFGKPVRYVELPHATFVGVLQGAGLPEPYAIAVASFQTATREGKMGVVTNAVQELSGRAPISVKAYLANNKGAFGA